MRSTLLTACLVLPTACASAAPPEPTTSSTAPEESGPDHAALAAEGDPDLERALRAAIKLERDKTAAIAEKIRAWEAVVEIAGDKQAAEMAEDRIRNWSIAADAEERRREALGLLREHYGRHLIEVRSGKMSLQELCDGYRSHAQDLLELRVDPPYATMCKEP